MNTLNQDSDTFWAVLETAMNILVLCNVQDFLNSCGTGSFPRRNAVQFCQCQTLDRFVERGVILRCVRR
jgi:hypothetical protein